MMLQTAKRFPVSTEFIIKCATGSTNLYKKHIMQALIECGYADSFNGELYNTLFSKDSEDNILVVPKYENVKDVIDAIHTAGGIAILAHPYASDCVKLCKKSYLTLFRNAPFSVTAVTAVTAVSYVSSTYMYVHAWTRL